MKRVVLALDLQSGLNPPEPIVQKTNRLAGKIPTVCTLLTKGDKVHRTDVDWTAPKNPSSLIQTRFIFERHDYEIPLQLIKTLEKNEVEEVFVVGANTEAFLLSAGFALYNAGFVPILVAPLCLTGQYHQHSVTMKIWENSIGPVIETVSEMGVGIS